MGIEVALLGAGVALSAAGQMQTASGMKAAGRAAMQSAEFNKGIRDRNARVADQEVLRDNANEAEEEVQTIRLTAATDAGRMREQGVNQRLAGQVALLEGRQQKLSYDIKARSARMGALTTLAKGGYQVSQII